MQNDNEKKDVSHSDYDSHETIPTSPLTKTSTYDQFEDVMANIMPRSVSSSLTPEALTKNDQIKSEPCKETSI